VRDEEQRDRDVHLPGQVAPEMLRVGVRMALLLILPAVVLLAILPRDSVEFTITIFTLAIGLFLLGFVALLTWWANRQ
jgi:hypothetical protein